MEIGESDFVFTFSILNYQFSIARAVRASESEQREQLSHRASRSVYISLASFAHSRLQSGAFLRESFFTLLVLICAGATPLRCLLAVLAEGLIGIEVVFQIATHELDHDAVIE